MRELKKNNDTKKLAETIKNFSAFIDDLAAQIGELHGPVLVIDGAEIRRRAGRDKAVHGGACSRAGLSIRRGFVRPCPQQEHRRSSRNQSSAQDLARLVGFASNDALLSELSTSPSYQVAVGRRTLQYSNTNRLIKHPAWDIGLQKTGYISEAGQCLVMQAKIAGRKLIMVFLDSAGKLSRIGDAERVRRWVESNPALATPLKATSG